VDIIQELSGLPAMGRKLCGQFGGSVGFEAADERFALTFSRLTPPALSLTFRPT
jgi:hypothetical protein